MPWGTKSSRLRLLPLFSILSLLNFFYLVYSNAVMSHYHSNKPLSRILNQFEKMIYLVNAELPYSSVRGNLVSQIYAFWNTLGFWFFGHIHLLLYTVIKQDLLLVLWPLTALRNAWCAPPFISFECTQKTHYGVILLCKVNVSIWICWGI